VIVAVVGVVLDVFVSVLLFVVDALLVVDFAVDV
jgi:hypothetical protein